MKMAKEVKQKMSRNAKQLRESKWRKKQAAQEMKMARKVK